MNSIHSTATQHIPMVSNMPMLLELVGNVEEILPHVVKRVRRNLLDDAIAIETCCESLNILHSIVDAINSRSDKVSGDSPSFSVLSEIATRPSQTDVHSEIQTNILAPLLTRIFDDGTPNKLLEPMCRLACTRNDSQKWLIEHCLTVLCNCDEIPHYIGISRRRVAVTVDILTCLLSLTNVYSSLSTVLQDYARRILSCFERVIPTDQLGKFCLVVRRVIALSPDSETWLRNVWTSVSSDGVPLDKVFVVLCTLADYYLTSSPLSIEVYNKPTLWKIVQDGLCDTDSPTRKRALYVLKRVIDNMSLMNQSAQISARDDSRADPENQTTTRELGTGLADLDQTNARFLAPSSADATSCVVFSWSSALRKKLTTLWQDFILIMEMIEENQVSHFLRDSRNTTFM